MHRQPRQRSRRPAFGALLLLFALLLVGAGWGPVDPWPRAVRSAFGTIEAEACRAHVSYLASDALEGRAAGEDGGRHASEYIAMRFIESGVGPGGPQGSYFQRFPILLRPAREGSLRDSNFLRVWRPGRKVDAYALGEDLVPHPRSAEIATGGELVYLTEGALEGELPPEVSGRIVVIREESLEAEMARTGGEPPDGEGTAQAGEKPEGNPAKGDAAPTDPALARLQRAGVRGVIALTSVEVGEEAERVLPAWPESAQDSPAALPILLLHRDAAEGLLRKGRSRPDRAESGGAVRFADHVVFLSVSRKGHPYGLGRNVVGMLTGGDPERAAEQVVVGAHFDHVGRAPNPQLTRGTPGEIHNGADDNASGTAGLIELARAFAGAPKIERARSLVFIAFDAEELGLVGSRHYVAHCPRPIEKTVAMLNMDMISRNGPLEMFYGKDDRFTGLNSLVEAVGRQLDLELDRTGMDQYMKRSDQAPFIEKGIPAVFLFGGDHPEYHTERDDVERIDPRKIQNVARFMFLCAWECANHDGPFGGE